MSRIKYTRTQEKQYSGWVAFPSIGFRIPSTDFVTTKERPWLLATPMGIKPVSATELANGFLFKADKGVEPINTKTAKFRMVDGIVPWTAVVRNTANVLSVMARHIPSSKGLGHFEFYPELYGEQYMYRLEGPIFVRMYTLHGGLRNIATPEQALGVTPKPSLVLRKSSLVEQTVELLPIPEGMQQSYGEALSKFYADIKAEARLRYKAEVTNGALFNSGYLGLSFIANGHRFNLFRGGVGSKLVFASKDFKKSYELSSDVDESLVKAKALFYDYLANPREKLDVGATRDLKSKDYTKFENCVSAEKLTQGVILTIKKDVTSMDLLRFDGFTGDEAFFKYEGLFNEYGTHRMLVGFKNGTTWSYTWGSSTTLASNAVWARNRIVVAAMEKLTGEFIA